MSQIQETIGGEACIYMEIIFYCNLLMKISFILMGFIFRLEIEGSGKTWKQDQRIRLKHIDTGGYLHSHNKKYTRIAGGQQEVTFIRIKVITFSS